MIRHKRASECKLESKDEHQCIVQEADHYEGEWKPCNGDLNSSDSLAAQPIQSENSFTEGIINIADLVLSWVGIFDWHKRNL